RCGRAGTWRRQKLLCAGIRGAESESISADIDAAAVAHTTAQKKNGTPQGSIFLLVLTLCYRLISYALSLLYKVLRSIFSSSAAFVLLKPVFSSVEMMACRSARPETDLRRL